MGQDSTPRIEHKYGGRTIPPESDLCDIHTQDQLLNLQAPVQNESVGVLFQKQEKNCQ